MVQIRWLTPKKNWTPPQRKMMRKAGRYHAVRGLVVGRAAGRGDVHGPGDPRSGRGTAEGNPCRWAGASGFSMRTRRKCRPSSARWPSIDSGPIRCCARNTTRRQAKSRQKLHASLALLPVDATQVDYLYGRLLDAEPHEVPVIRDALAPHKDDLLDKLWAVVEKPEKGKESQRLRAAAALAKYDPESEKWAKCERSGGQRSGAGKPGLPGPVERGVPSGARDRCLLRCPTSFEIANRSETRNAPWRRTFWPTTPPTSRRSWPIC